MHKSEGRINKPASGFEEIILNAAHRAGNCRIYSQSLIGVPQREQRQHQSSLAKPLCRESRKIYFRYKSL